MPRTSPQQRRQLESLAPEALAQHQLSRVNSLLAEVLPQNRFYEEKLSSANLSLSSLEELADLPYTFKDELTSTSGEFAANLTYPADRYVRYHRTSGTRGRPIVVLDTVAD
jgi:phenylacetate-CoA ligase